MPRRQKYSTARGWTLMSASRRAWPSSHPAAAPTFATGVGAVGSFIPSASA
jgi:hypothetical protein